MNTTSDRIPFARDVERLSVDQWGKSRATVIVGSHEVLAEALAKVEQFARSESPVLITGETGTGKELFARALFLAASHHRRSFLTVNCAQYTGTELAASELFGHRKGAFTGAVAEHRGVFEEANGGTIFLDEIGDLPMTAQAMLLRTLGEGEVVAVGGNRPRAVDVRVIAATSRDLKPMIAAGTFRSDLYYRLRQLHVRVPPVRDRGDDWRLLIRHQLECHCQQYAQAKFFSPEAMYKLKHHAWPGNVREVKSVVETGWHLSTSSQIDLDHFLEALEEVSRNEQMDNLAAALVKDSCMRMATGDLNFWEAVHRPFLERELNRTQVKTMVAEGLGMARGSYKRMLSVFGIAEQDYLRFMDFLRHHDLKPDEYRASSPRRVARHAEEELASGAGSD